MMLPGDVVMPGILLQKVTFAGFPLPKLAAPLDIGNQSHEYKLTAFCPLF